MPRIRVMKTELERLVENKPTPKQSSKIIDQVQTVIRAGEVVRRQLRPRLQNITNPKVQTTEGQKRKRKHSSSQKMAASGETVDQARGHEDTQRMVGQETVPTAEENARPAKKLKLGNVDRDNCNAGKADALPKEKSAKNATDEKEADISMIDAKVPTEKPKTTAEKQLESAATDNKDEKVSPAQAGNSKTTGRISLRGQTQLSSTAKPTRSALPQQLLTVLSNLYLNASERLRLRFPPRCAEDLAYCYKHHYQSPAPATPKHTQAQMLRSSLQQQRYITYLDMTFNMCCCKVFPGGSIFANLIEFQLSINQSSTNVSTFNCIYLKSMELFNVVVGTFPPCWLEMRRYYSDFFQGSLDVTKLAKENPEKFTKADKMFNMILDMLEHTLMHCTAAELIGSNGKTANNTNSPPATTTDTTTATTAATTSSGLATPGSIETHSKEDNHTSAVLNSLDVSGSSECVNQWEWEKKESRLQTFDALGMTTRLERLFSVLRLLLKILETDLVMWLLHHHKKTKDWIFCRENRPLIVQVFELQMYTRCTLLVKHLFRLFAIAVSRDLSQGRLQILERYIALIMVASNTADMENTVIGVKYPYLGTETKKLIKELFKIFKAHNTSKISTYVNTAKMLRIPYVRYELIDHFLQLFYFSQAEEMSPKKIAYDMSKKRFLKYLPYAELQLAADENLSRESYLELLLEALCSYCEWHGSLTFFEFFSQSKQIANLRTTTDSVHRWPTRGNSSGVLMMNKISRDIKQLMQLLKMTVRMSKPKVDLPVSDICIDEEIITKYRNDLKYVMIMREMLPTLIAAHSDVDFNKWQTFLNQFEPNATAK